ncbi:unnamed protein product [Lampetra fluviatilis]
MLAARVPSFQQRLPVLREFSAAGGDWATFQWRFLMNCEMFGWTEAEELWARPAALDDNALAALVTIPPADWATLHQAMQQMAVICGPLSNTHHRFAAWRCGDTETPLAFCSVLLALVKVAYPRMHKEGIDALVMEKLLSLALELRVIVHPSTTPTCAPCKLHGASKCTCFSKGRRDWRRVLHP